MMIRFLEKINTSKNHLLSLVIGILWSLSSVSQLYFEMSRTITCEYSRSLLHLHYN
jgi:hypothetical protein